MRSVPDEHQPNKAVIPKDKKLDAIIYLLVERQVKDWFGEYYEKMVEGKDPVLDEFRNERMWDLHDALHK